MGLNNPMITDIAYDSRKVKPGSLFVVRSGNHAQGTDFIGDACARGAVALLIEKEILNDFSLPCIMCKDVRHASGSAASRLFAIEHKNLTMVGITGTNGKTTSTFLMRALLASQYLSTETWAYTTIGYFLGGAMLDAPNTTPESIDIMRQIAHSEIMPKAVCMEVSSHALALSRVYGLRYDIGIFTNLTHDHLDFHHDMESYYVAKKSLFVEYLKPNGTAVINIDDAYGLRLSSEINKHKIVRFGMHASADLRIVSYTCSLSQTTIALEYNTTNFEIVTHLPGLFNVYNCAGVIAAGFALGIPLEKMQNALKTFTAVPGRMELVPIEQSFKVFVDYAHTPDALKNVLLTIRNMCEGNIICVFGCGGDRDATKRAPMGSMVAEYANEAIVTSDNPRSENPHTIIHEVIKGIPLDFPHYNIADRTEAIDKALSLAKAGDVVLIAGKGHEDYQEIKGIRHHFSDRETVLQLSSLKKVHHEAM